LKNFHVALQGVADAENMGMIIRNCVGFGVDTLIVGSDSSSPYLRRSVRVSVGTIFSLRILIVDDVLAALKKIRTMHSWQLVATTPEYGSATLPRSSSDAPLCLMFGSEAYGLTDKGIEMADLLFTIPMHEGCDSLNVANSLAVTLYEALREK
jgi:tRNA G18 (ribose-2'-O)-methylase SpoU